MKPYILLTLGACFLYAVENVMLELRLAKVSSLLTFGAASALAVVIIILLIATKGWSGLDVPLPEPTQWRWVIFSSLFSVGAGMCFYTAYTIGGNATTITILVVSLPVFATLVRALMEGSAPDWRYLIPWTLVALAVVSVQWIEKTNP